MRLAPTRTDKVPNTSATAASSGADLNGGAVKNACEQIRERLLQVAATSLGISPADVRIEDGEAHGVAYTSAKIPWDELVKTAYFRRVQLFAAGYYRTEGLHWDSQLFQGRRSSTSPTASPRPRSRSTGSPAPTAPGGSTSSTTSATASRRWSTSARSRAGSSRAPAG